MSLKTILQIEDDGISDVSFTVDFDAEPDIRKHAALGSIVILAILELDVDRVLQKKIDELLAQGPINEVDLRNRINQILNNE